jgi:hypothetical protein
MNRTKPKNPPITDRNGVNMVLPTEHRDSGGLGLHQDQSMSTSDPRLTRVDAEPAKARHGSIALGIALGLLILIAVLLWLVLFFWEKGAVDEAKRITGAIIALVVVMVVPVWWYLYKRAPGLLLNPVAPIILMGVGAFSGIYCRNALDQGGTGFEAFKAGILSAGAALFALTIVVVLVAIALAVWNSRRA